MKRIILLLTFVLSNSASEVDMSPHPGLNYWEKTSYIDNEQFNKNIQSLLSQNENLQKIANCLLYLSLEINNLKFDLNGSNTQIRYLNHQVANIEQTLKDTKQ